MYNVEPKRKITSEMANKIIAMAKADYYPDEIAKEMNINISSVRKHLPKNLWKIKPKILDFTQKLEITLNQLKDLEKIKNLINTGSKVYVNCDEGNVIQVTDYNLYYKNENSRICSVKWVDVITKNVKVIIETGG